MKPEQLKEMLDKAELMGFDRGVKTIFLTLFNQMEEEKMLAVSYKSLKELYEEMQKQVSPPIKEQE